MTCKWRHWAKWAGPYRNQPPSGKHLEFRGVTIATVTEELKIQSLEFFMDFNPLLAEMGATVNCPMSK